MFMRQAMIYLMKVAGLLFSVINNACTPITLEYAPVVSNNPDAAVVILRKCSDDLVKVHGSDYEYKISADKNSFSYSCIYKGSKASSEKPMGDTITINYKDVSLMELALLARPLGSHYHVIIYSSNDSVDRVRFTENKTAINFMNAVETLK